MLLPGVIRSIWISGDGQIEELDKRCVLSRPDHPAGHGDHALDPGRLDCGKGGVLDVDHALGQSEVVPQVQEHQLPVVATTVSPPGDPGSPVDMFNPQLVAAVSTVAMHGDNLHEWAREN